MKNLVDSSDKGKATPITGLWGPEGSGRLRLQINRHSAHEGGKVVTLMHRPPLPPGISWYSFLEADRNVSCHRINSKRRRSESIPGPSDLWRSAVTTTLPQVPRNILTRL